MGTKYKHKKTLSIAEQCYTLKKAYPTGTISVQNNRKSLIWRGWLRPTPFSRDYAITLRYQLKSLPQCIVTSPDLSILSMGNRIPHIYHELDEIKGTNLCLFDPGNIVEGIANEWNSALKLSETIIPWACIWLCYYEHWLYSGEWQGGGRHPVIPPENKHTLI